MYLTLLLLSRTLLLGATVLVGQICRASASDGDVMPQEQSAYPDVIHWAAAGVRGAIPSTQSVALELQPGQLTQAAIDRIASSGGGVISLAPGRHELFQTLHLRSGVSLRGAAQGETVLVLRMRGRFAEERGADGFSEWTCGLDARNVSRAGLERLTIVFDPSLPPPPTLRDSPEAFVNNPGGLDDLWVVAARFTLSEDCWLEDVKVLNSGTHPLMIEASRHITVRRCEISGAHNKGGMGAGYLNITRSEYVLLEEVTVRDLRHVAIQNSDEKFPCRYNVILRCHFEVDLNFHNGDSGHNLVEDTTIAIPAWHWWPPIAAGSPGLHTPPGPNNLVFKCRLSRSYPDPSRNYTRGEDPNTVYIVRSSFDKTIPLLRPFGKAPASGTLAGR